MLLALIVGVVMLNTFYPIMTDVQQQPFVEDYRESVVQRGWGLVRL